MDQPKKLYIDDFMSDGSNTSDDEAGKKDKKGLDRKAYEENKSKFDIKKLISNFILK